MVGGMPRKLNNSARDLLRILVLKTNPYFPFRYCNLWPYSLALRAAIEAVRDQPEITALYVRHGVGSDRWIPGLSDVDLTLIVECGVSAAREFDLLDSLHRRFRRLRRSFPMLGELEVLGGNDLSLWMPATCNAPEPRPWTLAYGAPVIDFSLDRSPGWQTRALNFALWIYLDLIPPCLAKPDSYLTRADARRRVLKILRLLRPFLSDSERIKNRIGSGTGPTLLAAHAAKALETALAGIESRDIASKSHGSNFAVDRPPIRSAAGFPDKVLVVLEDGLEPEQTAAALISRDWKKLAVPLSASVFRYTVRRYDPYIYPSLLRKREIVFGADPLEAIAPPGKAEFTEYLYSRLAGSLVFVRSPELFQEPLQLTIFESELRRLMGLRLLLHKGWIAGHRAEIDAEWRREFSVCAQALDAIKLAAGRGDTRAARRDAFLLFRSVAAEVCEVTAESPPS